MMKERLSEDLKAAMRAKDEPRLRTIRSLRAALQEKEIGERKGGEATLSDEQEIAVLQKQAKQRRDAIEQFRGAGRDDLVAREEEELRIIEEYLPAELDDEEMRRVVHQIIMGMGATSPRDMGRVMPEAIGRLRGRASGTRIQKAVQEILKGLEAGNS